MEVENLVITPKMLNYIAKIDEFKGAWRALATMAPERLYQLKKVATIESIGSSTRIEGSKLSDIDIELILSNIDIKQFASRDEQEVAGYAEVMDIIFNAWDHVSLTENYIKQLHGILLKYSDKDERHRGHYKTVDNSVAAFDEHGQQVGVVFETVSPFNAPRRMESLIQWLQQEIEDQKSHSLIICAIFTVVFLEIHPFQDGNGRLSRVLTTLLLLKLGYNYVPYVSLESIIEAHKEKYYLSLRRTQKSFKQQKQNWSPWIEFFLEMLFKQTEKLSIKIEQENILMEQFSEASLKILEYLKSSGRGTVKELSLVLNINRETIKKNLQNLQQRNQIQLHGKGRGAWYSLR